MKLNEEEKQPSFHDKCNCEGKGLAGYGCVQSWQQSLGTMAAELPSIPHWYSATQLERTASFWIPNRSLGYNETLKPEFQARFNMLVFMWLLSLFQNHIFEAFK